MTPKILKTALNIKRYKNYGNKKNDQLYARVGCHSQIIRYYIYLPTIVPMPRSLFVTNVPIMLVKNSGALVPENMRSKI